MKRRAAPLTTIAASSNYRLCVSESTFELWRRSWWRDHKIESFARDHAGHATSVARLTSLAPDAHELPPPGQPFKPKRLTTAATTSIVTIAALVAVAGGVIAVATTGRSHNHSAVARSVTPIVAASTPPLTINGQQGWVYSDPTTAIFIQWTRDASTVTGSLTEVSLASPQALTANRSNAAFTGTIQGDSVTLSFPQGLGAFTNLAVQASSTDIVVSLPQPDGTLAPLTFIKATASQYNQDAARLNDEASTNQYAAGQQAIQASQSAAEQASQAAQAAAQQQAQAAADRAVDQNAQALIQAVAQTSADTANVTNSLAPVGQALTQEQADLTAVRNAAARVEAEAAGGGTDPDQVCSDADGVQSDADGVQSDADNVQSQLDGLAGTVQELMPDSSTTINAQAALIAAEQSDPQHRPGQTPPSATQVASATSAANAALAKAAQTNTSATAAANTLASQANQAATAAAAAGHC